MRPSARSRGGRRHGRGRWARARARRRTLDARLLGVLIAGGHDGLDDCEGGWGWEAARGRGCCAVRWPPRGTRRARRARRGLRGAGVSRRAVRGDLVGAARREDGAARTRDGHCAGGHGGGLEIARRRTGARDAPPPNAAPRTSEPRRASTVCRWRLGWRELLTASSRQAAVLVVLVSTSTHVCSFPDRWRAALFPRGTSSCATRARTRTLTLAPALIAPPALSTRPLASAPGLERWASTTDTGGASTGRRSSRTLRSRGRTTDAPRPTAPRASTSRGTRTTPRPSRTRARTTTISPRRDEEVRVVDVHPRRGPLLAPSPPPRPPRPIVVDRRAAASIPRPPTTRAARPRRRDRANARGASRPSLALGAPRARPREGRDAGPAPGGPPRPRASRRYPPPGRRGRGCPVISPWTDDARLICHPALHFILEEWAFLQIRILTFFPPSRLALTPPLSLLVAQARGRTPPPRPRAARPRRPWTSPSAASPAARRGGAPPPTTRVIAVVPNTTPPSAGRRRRRRRR